MKDIWKKPTPRPPQPFILPQTEPVFPAAPPSKSSSVEKKPRSFWCGTVIFLGAAFLLLFLALGALVFKALSLGDRMQFENKTARSFVTELKHLTSAFIRENPTPLRGEAEGRINILLLGRAGEHYPGKNLTDTVMVMSIAPETKQVALLSLPRDLYVPIADTSLYTKLNSVYQYGLSSGEGITPLTDTVKRITGSPIHYFVTIDFDSFEKVVDTLGGISVEVPRDLIDTRYPGKNYSYETFEIKKGWQTLDGATTLKYVRERHADPEGDFGRAKRQQQVIQAIKNKAFSLGTLFNIVTVNRLLDTFGDNVRTDMSIEEMARFLELARTLDTQNVTTVVVDAWKKESLLRVSHIQVGSVAAFILVPRVGNWSEIQDVSKNIFRRDELAKRKRAITTEAPTITLYTRAADRETTEKIATLLREELGFAKTTVTTLPALNTHFEGSIIVGGNSQAKPFSLDELLKRFSPTQAATLPFSSTTTPSSDFSLVIGSDLAEAFALPDTPSDLTLEDPSFSEPLPPQPKRKK